MNFRSYTLVLTVNIGLILNTEMSVFSDRCHCLKLISHQKYRPWAMGTQKKRPLFRLFIFFFTVMSRTVHFGRKLKPSAIFRNVYIKLTLENIHSVASH